MTIAAAEQEILRLHRRRMALNQMIRSIEEYILVAGHDDAVLDQTGKNLPKKPNLSVVYAQPAKRLMA